MMAPEKNNAKHKGSALQINPLVRFNYMPRVIGFIPLGIILVSIFHESRNVFLWAAIFLQVIIWPHAAYFYAKKRPDPRKAEYQNLYFETFLCGVWMNLASFQLWPSTVFFIGPAINLLATRGFSLYRNAVLFLVAGALVTGIFNGFHFIPESNDATIYACIAFLIIYSSLVAFLSYNTSKKLSISKQRTEAILSAIQNGMLIIEVENHKIMEVNPAAARMFGVDREKIVGKVCHRFICPAEEGACPITDKKQRMDNSERTLLNKDGHAIPILKTAVPITLEGRECLLESFIDISERKQMEEELRRLARAVEQSIDGIAVADMNGEIQFVNSAWAKMHGYLPDELLGKHLRIFHSEKQFREDVVPFNALVMKNGSHHGEVGHVKKDGKPFPTWMTSTIFKEEDGRSIGLLGIARDITDRKRAENELCITLEKVESMNRHLEEQTALANQMAVQAEAANIAKSQFLANMSHEIRTPMNAVIGMSDLLADTELTEKQRQFVKIIRQSGDSLLNIINDILDVSKIEAGKLELEIIDFDLINMLDGLNEIFSINARDRNLDFACDVDPSVPRHVSGDPGRIRQVLVNLVGNAIKFTPSGEVRIQVDRFERADSTDEKITLKFSVIDTGIGIAGEKIETLFDAFTQADASTTRKFGGTGLGLSIAKSLIEMMGGRIDVSSQVGRGSIFTFTVVLHPAGAAKTAFSAPEHPEGQIAVDDFAKKKHDEVLILVAEDFPINQEVVLEFLQRFGFAAHVVENGKKAIQALEKNDYDLVLMDVQMPEMDGIEATRVIRDPQSNVRNHDICIVALTGHAMKGDRKRYLEVGMNDYLSKPINSKALYDVLIRNLPVRDI
jgi:PAS domain S-box-containing protein